jgi:hypothetical protein
MEVAILGKLAGELQPCKAGHLRARRDSELARPDLRLPHHKVLTSLVDHWSGLTVFVDHPELPMDNNTAERCHCGPVIGHKYFYGSGALWSGRPAAMLFPLFQTVQLWDLDIGGRSSRRADMPTRSWRLRFLPSPSTTHGTPPSGWCSWAGARLWRRNSTAPGSGSRGGWA